MLQFREIYPNNVILIHFKSTGFYVVLLIIFILNQSGQNEVRILKAHSFPVFILFFLINIESMVIYIEWQETIVHYPCHWY